MFQSSSTCAAVHAASVVEPAGRKRQRQQRRAGQGGDDVECAEPPCRFDVDTVRDRPHRRSDRRLRLRHMHDAFGQHKSRAELLARPIDNRVPMLLLACDQTGRRRGAIEQQVGAQVFFNLGRDRLRRGRNAVDDRVGEPGERHHRRVDPVLLRVPFDGQSLGQHPRRRGQVPPRGRPHRPAVEQHRQSPQAPRRPWRHDRTAPAGSDACCAARTLPDRAAGSRKSPRRCHA